MRLSGFEFGPSARKQIREILLQSVRRFGVGARDRYAALIEQAIRDLVENPKRPGATRDRDRIHFHLRHSRDRVSEGIGRVRSPRHVLICKIHDGDILLLFAVARDAMTVELQTRIQEGEGG